MVSKIFISCSASDYSSDNTNFNLLEVYSFVMDSSVNVTVNDKIRHWIRTVLTHDSLPEDVREDLRKYGGSRRNKDDSTKTIPFSLLKKVFVLMKDENGMVI